MEFKLQIKICYQRNMWKLLFASCFRFISFEFFLRFLWKSFFYLPLNLAPDSMCLPGIHQKFNSLEVGLHVHDSKIIFISFAAHGSHQLLTTKLKVFLLHNCLQLAFRYMLYLNSFISSVGGRLECFYIWLQFLFFFSYFVKHHKDLKTHADHLSFYCDRTKQR